MIQSLSWNYIYLFRYIYTDTHAQRTFSSLDIPKPFNSVSLQPSADSISASLTSTPIHLRSPMFNDNMDILLSGLNRWEEWEMPAAGFVLYSHFLKVFLIVCFHSMASKRYPVTYNNPKPGLLSLSNAHFEASKPKVRNLGYSQHHGHQCRLWSTWDQYRNWY